MIFVSQDRVSCGNIPKENLLPTPTGMIEQRITIKQLFMSEGFNDIVKGSRKKELHSEEKIHWSKEQTVGRRVKGYVQGWPYE